jgi:hypothetical protein
MVSHPSSFWLIYPPTSVTNIFGHWLYRIDHKYKILLRVGGSDSIDLVAMAVQK